MEHYAIAPQQPSYYTSSHPSAPDLCYDYDYATAAPPLSFRGFSDRSPGHYDDQAFAPYFATYGGTSTGQVASTSSMGPHAYSYDDPGLAIPGPSSSQGPSTAQLDQLGEDDFRGIYAPLPQQGWQWATNSPYAIQGQASMPCTSGDSTHHKTVSLVNDDSLVRTPTAQLPTPAAMAVLLHSTSRNSGNESQTVSNSPLHRPQDTASASGGNASPSAHHNTDGSDPGESTAGSQTSPPETTSRERRHGCWMCHKSFDRPSTLRKHLLVHTGEKAFKCDTCGRRFGVASNLNRHVRKCVLKPVNTINRQSPDSLSPSANTTSTTAEATTTPTAPVPRRKRGRDASSNLAPTSQQADNTEKPKTKRRRRAPSPSTWIPPSLLGFNLKPEEAKKSVPVPLPPVIPSQSEERNSWDENLDYAPYHPRGWRNKLPGPGLGHGFGLGKDLRNLNLAGSGGFMLGRVSVF